MVPLLSVNNPAYSEEMLMLFEGNVEGKIFMIKKICISLGLSNYSY